MTNRQTAAILTALGLATALVALAMAVSCCIAAADDFDPPDLKRLVHDLRWHADDESASPYSRGYSAQKRGLGFGWKPAGIAPESWEATQFESGWREAWRQAPNMPRPHEVQPIL